MKKAKIGIMGCGNISQIVLEHDNPASDTEFTRVSVKNVQQMFKHICLNTRDYKKDKI